MQRAVTAGGTVEVSHSTNGENADDSHAKKSYQHGSILGSKHVGKRRGRSDSSDYSIGVNPNDYAFAFVEPGIDIGLQGGKVNREQAVP